jgi:hypothetical protein
MLGYLTLLHAVTSAGEWAGANQASALPPRLSTEEIKIKEKKSNKYTKYQ